MGIVYEAEDQVRGMRVALKELRHLDPINLYRFKREFRALSDLSHPNILTYYELISNHDQWFVTMELVDGPDFLSHVAGRSIARTPSATLASPTPVYLPHDDQSDQATVTSIMASDGIGAQQTEIHHLEYLGLPVPPRIRPRFDQMVDEHRLRDCLGQLAGALHVLHRAGMVHRDLKPSNVRVTGGGRVVLMDFGVVAELRQPTDPTEIGFILGTPSYMAPEQLAGQAPSATADWYAFGVMMYLAITGRLPYEGTREVMIQVKQIRAPLPPRSLVDGAPEDLTSLCMELLAGDPGDRPDEDEILRRLGMVREELTPAVTTTAVDTVTSFVGRARELRDLMVGFSRVRAGGSSCTLLVGPSGIGKTMLLERFIASVTVTSSSYEEPMILSGRCHQRESLAYKAFDGIIDDLSGHLVGMLGAERDAIQPPDMNPLTRLFPMMRRVPGCDSIQTATSRGGNDLRMQAIADLRTVIGNLALDRPVIIRIEDVQWIDDNSIAVLAGLLQSPVPEGLMVVATMRSEALGSSSGDRQPDGEGDDEPVGDEHPIMAILARTQSYLRLDLGPLSDDEQRALIDLVAGPGGWTRFSEPMWCDLSGHPMLLTELARCIRESPETPAALGSLDLEEVIWRRLSQLAESERALIEAVAVAGEPTPLSALARAIELEPMPSERASTTLQIARLARLARAERIPWLTVYHDKIREAICTRLDSRSLRRLHGNLAVALEGRKDISRLRLAEHFAAAGDHRSAALHYIAAAAQANHQLAFDRAADLYRQTLAQIDLIIGHDLREMKQLEILRCQAWIGLADGMRIVERTDEAIDLLGRARDIALRYQLIEELAHIHYLHGNLLFPRGDLDGCLEHHARARDYARSAGSPAWEARATSGLGDAQYMRGHMVSAYRHFSRCIEICDQHGLPTIASANLAMRGVMRYYHNELDAALHDCRRAVDVAIRTGDRRAELINRSGCLGMILVEMARFTDAQAELERALSLARALGARRFEPYSLIFLAKILAESDRRDEAEQLVETGFAICADTGVEFAGPMALGAQAFVTSDRDRAEDAIVRAQALLRAGAVSHNHLYFYRDAIDAMLRFEQPGRAEEFADALEDYTRDEPLPWSRFFVTRGRLLAAYHRADRDSSTLEALGDLHLQAQHIGLHLASYALAQALGDAPPSSRG